MFSFYCTQVLLQLVLDVTHKCLHNNMKPGSQLASCSTKSLYRVFTFQHFANAQFVFVCVFGVFLGG